MTALENAIESLRRNAFSSAVGTEPVEVGTDHAVFRLTITDQHKNPLGIVHGGVYFTLADTAAGAAVRADGRAYVTQDCEIRFLHSQSEGVITAEVWIRHRGKATCLADVNITNEDGMLLSTATLSFFCVDRAHFSQTIQR